MTRRSRTLVRFALPPGRSVRVNLPVNADPCYLTARTSVAGIDFTSLPLDELLAIVVERPLGGEVHLHCPSR